jgi:hypothetical protein
MRKADVIQGIGFGVLAAIAAGGIVGLALRIAGLL